MLQLQEIVSNSNLQLKKIRCWNTLRLVNDVSGEFASILPNEQLLVTLNIG